MGKMIPFFNRIMQRYLPDPFLFVVYFNIPSPGVRPSFYRHRSPHPPLQQTAWKIVILLKAKDIMGFCTITLVISGIVISLGLLFI
ncbi:hypothetical protein [Bacillus sp. AK031]